MAKRVVTRVGDVFCVEIDGGYKRYFQYVCKDIQQLNSAVIYIFKTKYPSDYDPVIEDIVRDDVSSCIHVFLRLGLWNGTWQKIGNSKYINYSIVENTIFGDALHTKVVCDEDIPEGTIEYYRSLDLIDVDPLTNWRIWKVGKERIRIGKLPSGYEDKVTEGGVLPPRAIKEWMRYGYNRFTDISYGAIKRKPWDDVDSYVKVVDGDVVRYSHFLGQTPMREMVVSRFGIVRLSREHPESQGETLRRAQFWETNWNFFNFIEPAEFEDLWQTQP